MSKNKDVARRGGGVAGKAREEAEKELGRSVSSKDNYLNLNNKQKIVKKK